MDGCGGDGVLGSELFSLGVDSRTPLKRKNITHMQSLPRSRNSLDAWLFLWVLSETLHPLMLLLNTNHAPITADHPLVIGEACRV